LNVGSGGGAAAAPTAGGAAAGGDAGAAEEKAEEKEEGKKTHRQLAKLDGTNNLHREGRVRRGYGLRSLRLSLLASFLFCTSNAWPRFLFLTVQDGWSGSFS
jgi:hypothetical protein